MLNKNENEYHELKTALDAANVVLESITRLDRAKNEEEIRSELPYLLEAMGKFSASDRSYIFEWLTPEHDTLYMTCEWCADGVHPTIDEMQNLRMTDLPVWSKMLENGEQIVSCDWNADREKYPQEFKAFDGQDIHALIVIPIFSYDKLNGYIGFDNPELSTSDMSMRLLSSVGGHIGSLKENLNMMSDIAEKQKILENNIKELNREKSILDALSVDYTSVYYCDLIDDIMEPLKQAKFTNAELSDNRIKENKQKFSFRIQYYCEHFVLDEYKEEFMQKLSINYLIEHLSKNDRIAYRYRAVPNAAGQQYFEVQVSRLKHAEGFKAVMGYRYVDDIVAEQEKQRKRLEDALAEAKLNNEIINSISKIYSFIYRCDLELGIYEEISAREEMHHYTGKHGYIKDLFGNGSFPLVDDEYREKIINFFDVSTLADRLQNTETISMEYKTKNGTWNIGRFIVKKRDKDGRATSIIYAAGSIDEQKKREIEYQEKMLAAAEDAKRANMVKTDFLRRMSHDIRTPINGIRGMIKIANHFPEDPIKLKECRDKVYEASGFLLDLVNSILDMNKLESGKVSLEHKQFDLYDIFRETDNIVCMPSEEKHIVFEKKGLFIEHRYLIGSPLHFRQILQNIATNAIKYNRDGGTVGCRVDEISFDGTTAVYRFECSDTGIGMSEEFLKHVFEPFAQENDNARTAYMGTGLGLAITKQLVELMGGTIKVESKRGIGSKFIFTLPFEVDKNYKAGIVEEKIQSENISFDGVRVLLAEDNELNKEIAEFMLENAGIKVISAHDGEEAVEIFGKSEPNSIDVILMDIMMPVMDGLTATKHIRSMDRADAKTIPIFAMTANAFHEDRDESLKSGMNEHLTKPLDEIELFNAIRKYVKN